MDAQNIYDNGDFLAGYAKLDRQVRGLAGAPEWPALQALLPPVENRSVVDLGCGFGWFSRWASENGAVSVIGIDVSANMLERARNETRADGIDYRRGDLESLELDTASADLVFSSLAFHYVANLGGLFAAIDSALKPGGSVVFSVEHPIFSAPTVQDFELRADGSRVWPLDRYLIEGERSRHWFVDGVVKQHRTVAAYVNSLIDAGLSITRLVEWGPSLDEIRMPPERCDDLQRPWFLLISATKPTV